MSLSDSRRLPPWLKRSGRKAVYAANRADPRPRVLPSFLIVGGQRCGTTSMFRALAQHPATVPPVLIKGVHYFDVDYRRGPEWYAARFPTRRAVQRIHRRTGMTPQAFESSPYYMFHPAAADRISTDLPGVRLIVLVRDPVERAYSAYAHERARGFESLSFEDALDAEASRLAGERARLLADPGYDSVPYRHQAYASRGLYVDALETLSSVIPRTNILVVDSHRFFAEPATEYARTLAFLGLPEAGDPQFERNNARPRQPMPAGTERRLRDFYRPHDRALTQWLGWTPSWLR